MDSYSGQGHVTQINPDQAVLFGFIHDESDLDSRYSDAKYTRYPRLHPGVKILFRTDESLDMENLILYLRTLMFGQGGHSKLIGRHIVAPTLNY